MKNKTLRFLFLFSILLCLTGCDEKHEISNPVGYINEEIHINISDCNIKEAYDNHFIGDGESYIKADCSNNYKNIEEQIDSWNKMPLSENLQLAMYGGVKNEMYYGWEFAKEVGIPEIKNGKYLFIDRHSESKDTSSDEDLFNRHSHNFTVAMYDSDSKYLYYYEGDS